MPYIIKRHLPGPLFGEWYKVGAALDQETIDKLPSRTLKLLMDQGRVEFRDGPTSGGQPTFSKVSGPNRTPTVEGSVALSVGPTGSAKRLGGGWYEIPNHEPVRGMAAVRALGYEV